MWLINSLNTCSGCGLGWTVEFNVQVTFAGSNSDYQESTVNGCEPQKVSYSFKQKKLDDEQSEQLSWNLLKVTTEKTWSTTLE